MRSPVSNAPLLSLVAGILIVAACSSLPLQRAARSPGRTEPFTASEQIAGEIMAYLMEVVLGRAGDPGTRAAWATRGRNLPLDFEMVRKRMFGPVPLRAELMVLDTNILGLSEVLYHYDPRLNLFKGTRDHDSLYPCAELMALRLFLVHKLTRDEKVSLSAMIRYQALFAPGSRDADEAALAAMNITAEQFRFLKAAFQSEPAFLRYLAHPFLISTLHRIGVVEQDAVTLAADQTANYRRWACPPGSSRTPSPVTIAILPSMNPMFDPAPAPADNVTPSDEYRRAQDLLERAILEGLARKGRHAGRTDRFDAPSVDAPSVDTTSADMQTANPRPVFFTPPRPMVIHPENAGRVIENVCPKADFTVILLGKNVYRALHIDPEYDIYPHQRRIYLDVADIQYQQMAEEVEAIVDAVWPVLTAAAPGPLS